MNEIKVEVSLCPEDRTRLDVIRELLEQIATAAGSPPNLAALYRAPEDAHPAEASTAHLEPPAHAPDPAPKIKPISMGEFQKAIVVRCAESAEMKQKVQDLVHSYAKSVSAIPEDKRAEVLEKLAAL